MDNKEIEKMVIEVLADSLNINPEKIKPESKLFQDLGLDSFGAVELAFELKDKFGIEILKEDMVNIITARNLLDYIYKRKNGK